jgi:DNA segregation ATPase FtsK/SpoIIIE-like protein
MKNSLLFNQAATFAAAHGAISISAVMREFRVPSKAAADLVADLATAGIVGDYNETDMRPYLGGDDRRAAARKTWQETKAQCLQILGASDEPARAWWTSLELERRAAVMRAAVVPWVHAHAAWDSLPESARKKLTEQHDKRRRNWALLNAEFSGRVSA